MYLVDTRRWGEHEFKIFGNHKNKYLYLKVDEITSCLQKYLTEIPYISGFYEHLYQFHERIGEGDMICIYDLINILTQNLESNDILYLSLWISNLPKILKYENYI